MCCVCVCRLVFAGRADHRAGWSWITDPLTKGGLARTGVGVPDLWRGTMPTRGLGWELTTFFTGRRHGCSTLSHHYTGSYAGAHLLPYSRGRLSFMFMCSQAIMVCSFSPSSYAQGECSLMRRNCNCNCFMCFNPMSLLLAPKWVPFSVGLFL